MYSAITNGIAVSVEPKFLPDQSDPENHRWFWAYTVRIHNQSSETVQLTERHWKITNGVGNSETVSGPGVVGEEPIIEAGKVYTYTSGCPLNTDSGSMEGRYIMRRKSGGEFAVAIPPFSLDLPTTNRTLN
ncbi:MAG: Co2+/Mg2+ efflux protein ApaG [Pseudomonadota bacterium]